MLLEFITVNDKNNGYGVSKALFLQYFEEMGITVVDKLDKERRDKCDASLVYSYPNNIVWAHGKKKVIFTMFETDKIPDDWIPLLKQSDLVINPTRWGKEVFKKAGIDCKVVNLGLNDDIFAFKQRKANKTFTFLQYEAFNIRKGWHELFEAWNLAFKPEDPVQIIFKTVAKEHGQKIISLKEYPNVKVINQAYSPEELRDLLYSADCFVYPSRGEGFGIPPLEAMATGIPVIAPNEHGISEYFDDRFMYPVKTKLVPAEYDHIKGDLGNFVKCDVEDLARQLKIAYQNRHYMRSVAKQISDYALNFTMRRSAMEIVNILKS